MISKSKPPKATELFHPREFAICGFSNSGKTTLISRLLKSWSSKYKVGFFKSDAHRFQMDKEGKDTYQGYEAGAYRVGIEDLHHWAVVAHDKMDNPLKREIYSDCDFVIVEGRKQSPLQKIVLIDSDKEILSQTEEMTSIKAYAGPWSERPNDLPSEAFYFQRDDVKGISDFILSVFLEEEKTTPLYGLVLTGGLSQRMQQDKARLCYGKNPQAVEALRLLDDFCDTTYLSSRPGQWEGTELSRYPQIEDRFLGFGPVGGILSAMTALSNSAWLVLACDLPYLDTQTLQFLVDRRDSFKIATTYRSSSDYKAEPLCTIYEPRAYSWLMRELAQGRLCPRSILGRAPVKFLQLPNKKALDNINYPHELKEAQKELNL